MLAILQLEPWAAAATALAPAIAYMPSSRRARRRARWAGLLALPWQWMVGLAVGAVLIFLAIGYLRNR